MTRQQLFCGILGAACTVLTACGDSTSPGNTRPLTLDAALAEASSTTTLATAGLAAGGVFVLPPLPTFLTPPSNCPFDGSTGMFACPSRTFGGITSSLSFQLLDASNQPQSEFNPTTTAAIRTVSDLAGTFSSSASTTSISSSLTQHGDRTLSGLLTDRHTLNGTGNGTFSTTLGGTTHTMTNREMTTDLVLPPIGSTSHWPLSGSIAMEMNTGSGSGFTSSLTMTFDGTSKVRIVVSGSAGTRSCTFDLQMLSGPSSCF